MRDLRRLAVRLAPAIGAAVLMSTAAAAVSRNAADGPPLLPDLDQELPSGLVITHVRHRSRTSWRLGFRSAVRNVGDGPLLIEGRRPGHGQRSMVASQVIERDGAPEDVVEGVGKLRYVRSPTHEHWHLLRFDRYELRRVGGGARVEDRKSGFCLGDRYASGVPPAPAVHTTRCGLMRPGLLGIREGISVGWGDDYAANLEGQWLELRGLPAGRYELVHRVNADRALRETSYANNAASVLLRLRWRRDGPYIDILGGCADSARCRSLRLRGAARTTRTSPSAGR
jgi:Lysyl oxidase